MPAAPASKGRSRRDTKHTPPTDRSRPQRVHLGHILAAVGLNVVRLGEWFLESSRAKTRITPFARLMADGAAA